MNCYVCATGGRAQTEPAVAICKHCGAGLCPKHVRDAAAWVGPGGMAFGCEHDTRKVGSSTRGSKAQSP